MLDPRTSKAVFGFALLVLSLFATAGANAGPTAGPRAGFFDSTWPYGRSDTWRTGAATGAGLPADVTSQSLVTQSVELPKTPYWGVTYTKDAIFVLGGQPFILEPFSFVTAADVDILSPALILTEALKAAAVRPYVAKIDPETMTVVDILRFPRPSSWLGRSARTLHQELACGFRHSWHRGHRHGAACRSGRRSLLGNLQTLNYVGNILLHENGKLYAVATSTLYEIDPTTMEITGTLDLPRYQRGSLATVYNGMTLAPLSGDIILKGFNFLDSSQPAILVAVDPSDLTIRYRNDQLAVGATRLTTVAQDGTQFIYAADATQTKRVAIGDSGFVVDEPWSQTYRAAGDGSTPAVSLTYMGDDDFVVFQNNNTVIAGVTAPLKLFTQETETTAPTIEEFDANSSMLPGGSWPSLTADPFNTQVIVTGDTINGILAGWRRQGATLTKLWETNRYQSSAGTAIASDQQHIYIDDRRCDDSGQNCRLFLVILNLTTGEQIAEVRVAGSSPSLGQIFLSEGSVFFVATEADQRTGFVAKVSVRGGS